MEDNKKLTQDTESTQTSEKRKVGFLDKVRARIKARNERRSSKVSIKRDREPLMQKYGPNSPFRGPGRVLQLARLDKMAMKFARYQYSEPDYTYSDSILNLELDRLTTLGFSKEVNIIRETLDNHRNKDKTYLLALARVSKYTNLLK